MRTLGNDVKYGFRMLVKDRAATGVAVLALALGIGVTTTIFSVVNSVLLQPLPYPNAHRLVSLSQFDKKNNELAPVSPANFEDFRTQARTFEHLGAVAIGSFILTGGEPERVVGARASAGLLDALGATPVVGRVIHRTDEAPGSERVVLLSHSLWQRRFGGETDLVGRTIHVNGLPHTVVGVLPAGFEYPEGAQLWVPLNMGPEATQYRDAAYLEVVGRLRPTVTAEQARQEVEAIAARLAELYPDTNSRFGAAVIALQESIVGDVRRPLLLLLGAVAFVLLIACANVANLSLARTTARRQELAVRAALGAGRGRLVRQLLVESALLSLLGGSLGLLLAWWGVDTLRVLGPASLPRLNEVHVGGWVVGFNVLASLLTGLIFGTAPAWQAARFNLNESLKESGRNVAGSPNRKLRSALVVAEVGLSLVLLAGAGLLIRTLWGLLATDPGFDPRGVLTAEVFLPAAKYAQPEQRAAFASQVLEQVRVLPGVESSGITTNLPLGGSSMVYGMLIEGKPNVDDRGEWIRANFRCITPEYLALMRVPLLRGRWLTDADTASAPDVMLINEAMARRFWPGEDPLGRRVRLARETQPAWREVVGIVGNMRHEGLHVEPRPEMYVPFAQQPLSFLRLAVRTTGEPTALAAVVRRAVWAVDKDQPITRLRPMTEVVAASVSQTRFYAVLLGVFAAIALGMAAAGLYSVMAYVVSQRTNEIGIRMALGADRAGIFRLVVGRGMSLTLAGIAVGLAASFWMTRFLGILLHGIRPTDPLTFLTTALALAATAALACYLPARRAMRVDPIVALRYE